jgi:hypothetical protein
MRATIMARKWEVKWLREGVFHHRGTEPQRKQEKKKDDKEY